MELHFGTDDSSPPLDPTIVEPLTAPDSRFSCEVCGTPLIYAGKGRYPKFCAEHKPKPGTSSSGSAGRSTNIDTLINQMTELYQATGAALTFIPPTAQDGMIVTGHAVQLAESWRPLIQRDPKIRKFWEKVCTGGGWGTVLMAHSIVALAIMQAHNISLPGMGPNREVTNNV